MGDHMFKDLELSRGLMKEYTEHRERQGEESTQQKMSVMVLQRSFWPFTTRKEDADIPAWVSRFSHLGDNILFGLLNRCKRT